MPTTDVTPSRNRAFFQLPPRAWNPSLLAAAVSMDMGLSLSLLATSLLAIALGASPLQLGLMGVVWRIPYVLFCPVAGKVSDRAGRKRMAQAAALSLGFLHLVLTRVTTVSQLLCVVPFIGLATGMFWPPLQSWIGDMRTGELGTAVGKFNIAWSSAGMLGTLLAGFLSEIGTRTPFLISACLVVMIVLLVTLVPEQPPTQDRSSAEPATTPLAAARPDPETHRAFLHAAWVANLVAFIGIGTITTFFPKLGADLGLSPSVIGMIVSTFALGRLLTFVILTRSTRWQYHARLLVMALLVSAASMGLASASNTLWLLAFCFAIMGVVGGITYTASLFYALDAPGQGGANAGIHESLLSAGLALSAFSGGVVAQTWGLRAPFLLSGVILLVGTLWIAWRLDLHATGLASESAQEP